MDDPVPKRMLTVTVEVEVEVDADVPLASGLSPYKIEEAISLRRMRRS